MQAHVHMKRESENINGKYQEYSVEIVTESSLIKIGLVVSIVNKMHVDDGPHPAISSLRVLQ